MIVRENIALGADDDTRAEAGAPRTRFTAGSVAEEVTEYRVVEQGMTRA
jgi:hypothetical protein